MLETCTIWRTFLFYLNYIIFYNIWNLLVLQYDTHFVFDEQTLFCWTWWSQAVEVCFFTTFWLFHHLSDTYVCMLVSQQRHFSWLKNITSFVWLNYNKVPITSLFDVPSNSPLCKLIVLMNAWYFPLFTAFAWIFVQTCKCVYVFSHSRT